MKLGHMSLWLWRKIQTSFLFGSIKSHLLKIQVYCLDEVLIVTWFNGQTERPNAKQRICLSVSINKPRNLYMLLIFIVIVLG